MSWSCSGKTLSAKACSGPGAGRRRPEVDDPGLRVSCAEEVVGNGIFKEEHDNMIMVRDIELYSMCEHHMLPFFGKAHVAYIPNGKIVGLSKIPRIVDVYAQRLQVQERLTEQIAEGLCRVLNPSGSGRRDRGLPPVHDDARRAEAELEDDHLGVEGSVPRRSQDAGRVPAAGAQRI